MDDPHAPEIFASGAYGLRLANGVVSITFASVRLNHASNAMRAVVVGTIVMPSAAAQGFAARLNDFLAQNGLTPKLPGTERMQ